MILFVYGVTNKNQAVTYNLESDMYDSIIKMNNVDLSLFMKNNNIIIYEINPNDGFILKETDDGDNGYLFVFNKNDYKIIEISETKNVITSFDDFI